MHKSSHCFRPGDISYLGEDAAGQVYSCVMPITGVRQEFTVTPKVWATKTLPMELCFLADYIEETRRMLNMCRDIRPLSDLHALDFEESKVFDVRYIPRAKHIVFHRKA